MRPHVMVSLAQNGPRQKFALSRLFAICMYSPGAILDFYPAGHVIIIGMPVISVLICISFS